MEKMKLGTTYLSVERTNKYISEVKANNYCLNFITKNSINDYIIERNLLVFNHVISDRKQCENCLGLQHCKKAMKGLVKELEYLDGNVIEELVQCDYQKLKQKLIDNFLIRDFEDEALNYRLNPNDIDDFRKTVSKTMGRLINGKENKGLYIYGDSGVGKSYLAICLANRQVENGKTVAYVNARNSVSLLRGYVINDKEKFAEFIDKMKNAELLIIDDLGNEKITDWSRDSIFYEVLDYRLRNRKNKIIINSNYTLKELKELYKVDNEVRAKRFINLLSSVVDEYELIGINRFL